MPAPEGLVPGFISEDLVEQGLVFHFAMARSRPDSIAWRREEAIRVIEALADHGYAILGGDVLALAEDKLDYTGDYWDLPDTDVILWDEYVEDTKERSIAFIMDAVHDKGKDLLFAMFFIEEREYRRQIRDFGNVTYR